MTTKALATANGPPAAEGSCAAQARIRVNRTAAAPSLTETLGLDQEPQAPRYAGFAQERDHRDRVGRGDKRAEDERGLDRPPEPIGHPAGNDRCAERDADSRQRDHGQKIAPEFAPVQVQCRLEQERRQDDVENEVVRQRETGVDAKRRQRRPCEREPHRIGQPEPARGERNQDGEAEQRQGADDEDVHAGCFSGAGRGGEPEEPAFPPIAGVLRD